jgi:hypothetical protein
MLREPNSPPRPHLPTRLAQHRLADRIAEALRAEQFQPAALPRPRQGRHDPARRIAAAHNHQATTRLGATHVQVAVGRPRNGRVKQPRDERQSFAQMLSWLRGTCSRRRAVHAHSVRRINTCPISGASSTSPTASSSSRNSNSRIRIHVARQLRRLADPPLDDPPLSLDP